MSPHLLLIGIALFYTVLALLMIYVAVAVAPPPYPGADDESLHSSQAEE